MPRVWIEPEVIEVPPDLLTAVNGHVFLSQLLYRRGLSDADTVRQLLNPSIYQPSPSWELPDMDGAVEILSQAIQHRKKICVWGDFDVDGQTATTLLVSTLRSLGADVLFHIPVRAIESHGIDVDILANYISNGIGILLTCDTGVSACQAIDFANQHDLPVIVTDHHDLPPELPPARAVINPKRLAAGHPLATLPGVGVAYKLAEALYHSVNDNDAANNLLDLVALGIVADLATLHGDTRYLLQRGISVLHQTSRLGLQTLAELAELDLHNLTEEHIGFTIAPRLNALGRLGNANSMVEFLTTNNPSRARSLAYELEALNTQRKMISDQVFQGALAQIEADPSLLDRNVIVLPHTGWPAGVIGIVASRLVERYAQPVILLSTHPGEPARGSARSVEGINITEAIATQAHLLVDYGGHPMAAGLSIIPDNIPEFQRGLARAIALMTGGHPTAHGLPIDEYVDLASVTSDLVSDIETLAPFGPGNPPPILACRDLELTSYSQVGKHDEHYLLKIHDGDGYEQTVIWWHGADQPLPEGKFDLAFSARNSTYRAQSALQLEWIDYRPSLTPNGEISSPKPHIHVIDHRHAPEPIKVLAEIIRSPDVQIWCENDDRESLHAVDRMHLSPSRALVIWSIPPGPAELRQAVELTTPQVIYLFAAPNAFDDFEAFLKRLTGLLKYAIRHRAGKVNVAELAAATGHRNITIRLGLQWLQMHDHIQLLAEGQDQYTLSLGSGKSDSSDPTIISCLKTLLTETATFRQYYRSTDKDILINPTNDPR